VDQHHPAAADPAHLWVDDTLHERTRHRGIHGIPAPPHDIEPDFGRPGLGADDDRHVRKFDEFASLPNLKNSATKSLSERLACKRRQFIPF